MKNMIFNVNSHINLILLPPPPPNVKIYKERFSLKGIFLRKVLFPRKKRPEPKPCRSVSQAAGRCPARFGAGLLVYHRGGIL